jgi:hypothetical protein
LPSQLQKYLRLTADERRLLRQAAFWLLKMRILLSTAPYERAQRLADQPQTASPDPLLTGKTIGRAVDRAAKAIPRATCLVKALAAQAMLTRAGFRPTLELGVARSATKEFEAHAWLELDGAIVVGGQERAKFAALRKRGQQPRESA